MALFAIVMLLAALSMISDKKAEKSTAMPNAMITILQIFVVGIIIGLVGAGGGFLIIPALVYLAKLPMKKAVGTSIFIIAINSLIGFTGDLGNIDIDWSFLFIFSFISILGIFAGIYLNKFINEKNLKKGFGWFVLTMSILILTKEVFL
ncbi:Sulfite exporter TauE/SafE [compost metagenome]